MIFFQNDIDANAPHTYSQCAVSYSQHFHKHFPANAERKGGY